MAFTPAYPLSWRPDPAALRRPLYLSLAGALEQDIRAGLLRPGTRLPAQRELADALGINFTTVTRSYKLCEMKGLICGVTGSGTFVAQHAAGSVAITADGTGPGIDLAFVASFEQCNDMLHDAVRAVLHKKYFARLFDYAHPSGLPHQKEVARQWMRSFGLETTPDRILIVSGALNGVDMALLSLFKAGDRIAVETWSFPNFLELARLHGLQPEPIPVDAEGMLPDVLEARCRQKEIKGIFLMPSCCNPTTTIISEERMRRLAESIRRHRLILIEDDTHSFQTAGVVPDYAGPLARHVPEQTVYVCSTSKAISSGLRVGYIACPQQYLNAVQRAVYNTNVKTSSFNAEIVTELLRSGRADDIMAAKRELTSQATALYERYFAKTGPHQHPCAFFRWLPLKGMWDGTDLEQRLQRRGVLVYHSCRFASGTADDRQYLRIALSTVETMEALERGLILLRDELGRLGALAWDVPDRTGQQAGQHPGPAPGSQDCPAPDQPRP